MQTGLFVALCALFLSGAAAAADDTELAKQTQNPVSDLISLPFQNNTDFDWGPEKGTRNTLNIQPVWPVAVSEDWNVITRTIVPVVSQPELFPGQGRETGLGDTTFTAFLSPRAAGRITWGAGPVVLLPTSTDDRLGAGTWGLGGSAVVLAMPGKWVIGSLVSQVWDVGGAADEQVSLFTWQYFINYNLPNGWYLSSAPIMTANWEASGTDKWTVPVGGGGGRIFRIGQLPLNAGAQVFYNVAKPDFVGDWSLRLQLQLLFPR